jgi:hypothetical protein
MRSLALVVVAACGSVTAKPDAALDAPADVGVDGPAMAMGTHRHYVVDHQVIPTNNSQAQMVALDIDGNGTVDNQLGMVFGTLASMGFDVQGATAQAVDHGEILILADLQATDLTTAPNVGFTTFIGTNPVPPACNGPADTTCRHHLAGNGVFGIDPSVPRHPAVLGSFANGTFLSGSGTLSIQLAPFGAPIALDLLAGRVKITNVTDTAIVTGVIGGAVSQADINNKVLPSAVQTFQVIVQRDCGLPVPPDCGCLAGSTGKTLLGLFDTNPKDCVISLAEVQSNALIQSLLAPDLTIDGNRALSVGVGFTAVHGDFTP